LDVVVRPLPGFGVSETSLLISRAEELIFGGSEKGKTLKLDLFFNDLGGGFK